VVAKWASYDLLGAMRQLGTIPEPGQEEARAPAQEREEKGLMDKAKGRINEVGGTKDNVRDELDEAAERGRREGDDRKEAVPEEVGQPGSGARTISGRSGPNRKSVASQNSQFAKPGPGLWASRVNLARMEFSEVHSPWVSQRIQRYIRQVEQLVATEDV
jgi:hypothetical protein